ncbi:AfsR/SARP family transcriptional regulator [Amycolatopsis anabasis]|uniref:AfsR/SARP family transcriptional regulator n=1 Tax=Amycolatopsis anabasis TaxID=1840409 RepID=UPI00131E8C1F|nr:BTAD domain-containing putative transcriptional regulator [Amycolatopsis anabasis]
MRLQVLGRLCVRAGDGREVPVPSGKASALLLYLVGNHGQAVPHGQLVEALWGDEPPRTSTASLHNHISSLRSVLSRAVASGERRLARVSDGYQLDLVSAECDLIEFDQLLGDGRSAVRRGDEAEAVRFLRRALRLWRGTPTWNGSASTSTVPLDSLVRSWEIARVAAYEECLAGEISLGRHAEVIPELRELVAGHPLRERLAELLMRALWMAGDRADALRVYQNVRETLVGELGIEPGSGLAKLQELVLRGESPGVVSEPAPSVPVPRQLPAMVPDFTGREELIGRVRELLSTTDSVPVVALSAQAGAGKTATAVRVGHQLADRFPDGQLYLHLGGGSTSPRPVGDVLAEALRSLGVADTAIPAQLEQRAAAYRSRLAGRKVLIVLDDAAEARQVVPLLPGEPGNAVLVTSRRRLADVPGAVDLELSPLDEDESLRLLVQVLGADRVAAEPSAAAELVDLCGRLPIAIRVAAARLATRPQWSLGSLLTRMRDQRLLLDELSVAELDVRAGFAVSYQSLGELERMVFRRFALLDGADLAPWALAALTDDDPRLDWALHDLLTTHFLEPAAGKYERYTMHDLLRVFAAEQLHPIEGGLTDSASPARAAFGSLFGRTRSLIEAIHLGLPRPAGWLVPLGPASGQAAPADVHAQVRRDPTGWCAAECDTLVAILARGADAGWCREALDAVERLTSFLALKHRMSEINRLYPAVLAAAETANDRLVQARAKFGMAHGAAMGGRLLVASTLLTECSRLFEALGDAAGSASTLVLLSFCRAQQGDLISAERHALRALDLGQGLEDRQAEVRALRQLGNVRTALGDAAGAVEFLRRGLGRARRIGEADLEAVVLSSLSNALVELGELDEADELYRQAIKLLDELDQPVGRAHVVVSHSRVAELRGQHLGAVELIEQGLRVFRQFADRRGEVHALHRLAVNKVALGQGKDAVPLLRSAYALSEELGMFGRSRELRRMLAYAARR